MSDQKPRENIRPLKTPPRPIDERVPWHKELDPTLKALIVIGTVFCAGVVVAGLLGFGGVTKGEFEEHAEASEKKHAELEGEHEEFRQMRLEMKHLHEEQRATRQDFRAIFPRLGELPAETPTPVVHTSAQPEEPPR